MSSFHEKRSLQTKERAAEDAWIVYQRNVVGLSVAAICALAISNAMRRDDGSFDPAGGIGKPLARTTVFNRLKEAREQFLEDYIKRPVLDAIMEEDDRLEHLAATSMQVLRSAKPASPEWFAAYDRHLKTLESRRKLLGLDRPQQIEVTHEVAQHDDPASMKLKKAMEAAQARRDEMLAEVNDEGDNA